jgi:two-component system cell cycle sensor histidine kinase/response regulator CckA
MLRGMTLSAIMPELIWPTFSVPFGVEARGGLLVRDAQENKFDWTAAIVDVQQQFIAGPNPQAAFEQALQLCIEDSQSGSGFVGKLRDSAEGQPILHLLASVGETAQVSNCSALDPSGSQGIALTELDADIADVIRSGKSVLSNSKPPASKKRGAARDVPGKSFLYLPLFAPSGDLLGMLGLANRSTGNRPANYDEALVTRLDPICSALGAMLLAARRDDQQHETATALKNSEARLSIFADEVTDGIFLQDSQTRVVDVNQRACENLGYDRSELIGMTPLDFDPIITPEKIKQNRTRLAAGDPISFESQHRRKDGSVFPVEIRIRSLQIAGQYHTLALVCDITERKQAENKLQESQDRLQLAVTATGIGVWELDATTMEVYWSPECPDVYGIPSSELHSKEFMSFVHPDDVDRLTRWAEQTLREATYSSVEFRVVQPDGAPRWIATRSLVRRNESGHALKMIGSARNITQERLAADELRAQNAILQTILDSTTDFVYMKDRQGHYLKINAAGAAFIGKRASEIIGRRDAELFPPDVAQDITEHEQQLFDQETELRYEESIRRGDQVVHLSTAKSPCRDANGNVIGLVGITRNITAYMAAEEALRQSTLLLENVVENIPMAVFVKDPNDDFRIRLWNKAAEGIFGIPREQLIGRTAHDFWPQEQADLYRLVDERVMQAGELEVIAEEPSTKRGEGPIVVHTRKMPLFDRNGKPTLMLAICEDITERKRAEEELRQARHRLEFTLQSANVGLWDWNLKTNEVLFSKEWKSQLGYLEHEVGNQAIDWKHRVHPDDLAQAMSKIEDAMTRRNPEYQSEFRMKHKDGSWRWILSRGAVINDAAGVPVRMLGIHIDITERKEAEEALQASEFRYRSFVDHATDALFLQNSAGRILDVNQQACASLGYTRDELIGMLPQDFDADITTAETKGVLDRLETGETIAFDSRHKRKDGSTFPVEVRLRPFWIKDQRYHIGLVRDITERKRNEQALRESEARLRTLLENLDKVAVQAYEPDGTITFWNRASELFYGYSAAQALGRDMVELLHAKHTRDEERRIMAEALRTGKPPGAEEVEVVRRDGAKITVFASRVVHPRAGKPPEFFCFDVDVTDRKRAEEELAVRQAELLHASRLSTVGQMVAEISHEVAQPLNAIGNFAAASERILETDPQGQLATLCDYVRAILEQNQRCITILGRLRDFSRRAPTSFVPCDVGQLLHDSVNLLSLELRRNDVAVEFELAEALPQVQGDRVQLQQVIVNLLTNARDALEGLPADRRTIRIRSFAQAEAVVFEVEDAGSGLAGDALIHLFDPFFTTKRHGMGIGLSICQSIVKNHGGRIEAVSNARGGATFRVRLPNSGKGP